MFLSSPTGKFPKLSLRSSLKKLSKPTPENSLLSISNERLGKVKPLQNSSGMPLRWGGSILPGLGSRLKSNFKKLGSSKKQTDSTKSKSQGKSSSIPGVEIKESFKTTLESEISRLEAKNSCQNGNQTQLDEIEEMPGSLFQVDSKAKSARRNCTHSRYQPQISSKEAKARLNYFLYQKNLIIANPSTDHLADLQTETGLESYNPNFSTTSQLNLLLSQAASSGILKRPAFFQSGSGLTYSSTSSSAASSTESFLQTFSPTPATTWGSIPDSSDLPRQKRFQVGEDGFLFQPLSPPPKKIYKG
jgi:hypothetical protein